MKDLVKSLERVKERLAKTELPERWNQESFTIAQGLVKIIINRLEHLAGSKIQVKSIEPKISKIAPKLTEIIYILALEGSLIDIPKDIQAWDEETFEKIKSLSKSIVRKLQISLKREMNEKGQKIIIGKKTKCEFCGNKIKGSGEGYPEPIPRYPIVFCVPCRIALANIQGRKRGKKQFTFNRS
jgi:hypothetical protein